MEDLCFSYNKSQKLIDHFSLKIQGPERMALLGNNGSGKTTLVKLILNELNPKTGKIYLGTKQICYLDQNCSLLNPNLSVLENFLQLNPDSNLNSAYSSLAHFLFKNTSANTLVQALSGGEKLRALLACVLMSTEPPQLLILDEPTNSLDIDSIKSVESALRNYQGAMIVISHDEEFLKNIGIQKFITAPFF